MRYVIVSAHFDDQSRIGTARPRSFAHWLHEFGHEVLVVTRRVNGGGGGEDDLAGIEVIREDRGALLECVHKFAGRLYRAVRPSTGRGRQRAPGEADGKAAVSIASRLVGTASVTYRALDDYMWARAASRRLRGSVAGDVVFATYGPLASLFLGARLSKYSTATVYDFRDLVTDVAYPSAWNWVLARFSGRMVEGADAVTTVSEGLRMGLSANVAPRAAGKIHVVPNGFEPTESTRAAAPVTRGPLRVGYTGNMYAGRRDSSAFFEVLRFLSDVGAIDLSNVEVHYAGRDSDVFLKQAGAFGLESSVVNHGVLSKQEALDLQRSCDALLVLSWNTEGQTGIVTGKVYEYFGSGRPVIAVTGGEMPGAELSKMIRELKAGVAFEYVSRKQDFPQLADFVLESYLKRVVEGGPLPMSDPLAMEKYEFENLTRKLEELCEKVVAAGRPGAATN